MNGHTFTRYLIKHILSCFLLFITYQSTAQQDSLILDVRKLGADDVHTSADLFNNQRVVSASRSLKDVSDLPFTIYVITADDIAKNGYVTLVDALKSLPGIRVSQPGTGLEGETFMMRGLLGNTYAKILIDDIPIKPSVVSGMPIGAQLPIRHAERIEVIYGPAATLYGSDAMAGVINIILKETDRPTFVEAGLSVGENGYSDVDVMFGGKVGKGKRVLKFNLYGSNTVLNDQKIFYDRDSLYNPSLYLLGDFINYEDQENYAGDSPTEPTLNEIPHLSRMFGLNLKYRSLRASYKIMYRRDHSSIGLNPVAVSYFNPLNYVGERITNAHIGIDKSYKKFGFKTNVSVLTYEMDKRSSYTYVNNSLNDIFNFVADEVAEGDPVVYQNHINTLEESFFSGTRFSYASSLDFYAEQLFTFYPNRNIEFVLGGNLNGYFGRPLINYQKTPYDPDRNNSISTFTISDGLLSSFCQLYLTFKKINVIGGLQYNFFDNLFNPRLAVLYKATPWLSFRGTYGTAFHRPSPFFESNTYTISSDDFSRLRTERFRLTEEKTESFEGGLRWRLGRRMSLDATFFQTETQNFVSYNFSQINFNEEDITLGYFNDGSTKIEIDGIQVRVRFKSLSEKDNFNAELSITELEGKEVLPFDRGEINGVRGVPDFMWQLKLSARLYGRFYLHLNNTYLSQSLSRNFLGEDGFEPRSNPQYYTLDVIGRLQLTDNFQLYLKANNIFNKEYGGIDATGFLDDLKYNPQALRTVRFGINYRID